MGWFEAFRGQQGYTWYTHSRTAAEFDVPLAAVTYFCTLIAIAVVIATLGIRGKEKWGVVVRTFYGVAIGSIILVSIYGHCWLMGMVDITSPYIYTSRDQFSGLVGLKVGLFKANVTLKGYFGEAGRRGEVSYSEALPWADYGREEEKMEVYLTRGLPDPILRVAAYLCTDSGGLRWGRAFHMAGNMSCILLWSAFAFWMLTNILLFSVIVYAAYSMILTGTAMLLASIVYHVCQPSQPLAIHFEEVTLRTSYGWCFWLILVSGVCTIFIGFVLLTVDHFMPKKTAEFFKVEISIGEDERYESTLFLNDPMRKASVYTIGDRRQSIFGEYQTRRQSIFTEKPIRRLSPSNAWTSLGSCDSLTRSASTGGFYDYDKIAEEPEDVVFDEKPNRICPVRIEIEAETDSVCEKGSDTGKKRVKINEQGLDDKITSADGVTTININSGRNSTQSSDSGLDWSETNTAFYQMDNNSFVSDS